MQENLKFYKSIQSEDGSLMVPSEWDKAVDAYEKKQYKLSIHSILRYVGKAIKDHETKWNFSHGSTNVFIEIENDLLKVHAPFLKIDESRKIPLMRQVVQLNFSPLNLSQIRLEDDLLSFDFSCPLELCEPYKIYDIFREMCINADANDDQFIDKFGASWTQEPSIERYDENAIKMTYNHLQEIIEQALKEIDYYENKRQFPFAWDVVAISLLKIEYLLQPQGSLRSKIEKAIGFMMSKAQVPEKINRGKDALRDLQKVSLNDLKKDLYAIDIFIPYKLHTNEEKLKTILEPALAQAKKERESGDVLATTLTLSYNILNLFYHNNTGGTVRNHLEKALLKSSGKNLKDSAQILIDAVEKLLTGKVNVSPNGPKGFFKRMFKL